jgi:hydrogenase maturation protease
MKIICIGNEMRKDDFIAIDLADELNAIKAFTNPENFITEGDEIILIDAVDFNAKPGSVKEFSPKEITEFALSTTHNIGINVLEKFCKIIKIIGIQPKDTSYEIGLSQELIDKKEDIVLKIKELINK